MLNETAPPVIAQPVLDELARHLKLPEPPDSGALGEAEAALRAAIAHLEAQLGLALVRRSFVWRGRLRFGVGAAAPIAPVTAISAAAILPLGGDAIPFADDALALDKSNLRTRFVALRPLQDQVEIVFEAGFGPAWSDTPADIRRAAFLLAAHYFDNRHAVGDVGEDIPQGVAALVAPWRPLRLRIGAAE